MAIIESEKELEDFIINSIEFHIDGVNPITDETINHYFQQVQIGRYGIADIIFIDIPYDGEDKPKVLIRIIELKKGVINISAIAQISRYKIGIEDYFSKETRVTIDVEGILVGSGYAEDGSDFLVESINWLTCYHYSLSLETGMEFNESCGWHIKDADFNFDDTLVAPIKKQFMCKYKNYKRIRNKRACQ